MKAIRALLFSFFIAAGLIVRKRQNFFHRTFRKHIKLFKTSNKTLMRVI